MKQRSNPLDWIEVDNAELSVDQFPDGSFSFAVKFNQIPIHNAYIVLKSTLPEALVALHQVSYAIDIQTRVDKHLSVQTMPDQRADRVEREGQTVAAVVAANMIGQSGVQTVTIFDPHSQVCVNALNTHFGTDLTVEDSTDCFLEALYHYEDSDKVDYEDINVIVAVDKGAIKRAEEAAQHFNAKIIYADKRRVKGKIVGHEIMATTDTITKYDNIWVVDDLCDGGATFISIAKLLREEYEFNELNLYVTHGLFSRGKSELQQYYNHIVSLFDYGA